MEHLSVDASLDNLSLSGSAAGTSHSGWKNAGPPSIEAHEIQYESKLGAGCFGYVYKGTCRGKEVAVKKLIKQDLDPAAMADFVKEVEIMSALRHPNVLLFMGACTTPGEMAIVTELLPGGNVEDLLKKHKVSLFQRMKMVRDTAQGMCWLHESKPQIIHRDLKPSNLLVDEHMGVKVCDFGLSAVKPLNVQQLQDGQNVPGTPLWMPPEILQGKPFDASSDVYSFGICLWEIYTCKEVFSHMQSFQQFKHAVCVNGERPPIPRHCVPSLAALMEASWHVDPLKRPTFREVITIMNGVLVDVAVQDTMANKFWKMSFFGKHKVSWDSFVQALAAFHHFQTPLSADLGDQFLFLRWILATKRRGSQANAAPDVVSLENFGKFFYWFGPMDQKGLYLASLRDVMKHEYFHGDIGQPEAERLLADRPKGTYLVRMSTTHPGCFTISKLTSHKKILHQRVTFTPNKGFSITIAKGKKKETIESDGSLPNFLRRITKPLGLSSPCSGSKYAFLYGKAPKHDPKASASGYLEPDDDEDWNV